MIHDQLIRIAVLGPPRIAGGSRRLEVPSALQRRLLAELIVREGRPAAAAQFTRALEL